MAWLEDSCLDRSESLRAQDKVNNASALEELKSQFEEYANFENVIKLQQEVMVHLGDGYIVSKNRKEALQFLNRRKMRLDSKMEEAKYFLAENAENQQHISQNQENEEREPTRGGLPLVDIQEKLDQSDNIIGVYLNDNFRGTLTDDCKKMSASRAFHEKNTTKAIQSTKDNEVHNFTTDEQLKYCKGMNTNDTENELEQLYEDMEVARELPERKTKTEEELMRRVDELAISENDKEEMKRVCLEGYLQKRQVERVGLCDGISNKESTTSSLGDSKQIDTHNLLELEVVANEVDSYEDYDSESDYPYDLSADQDDSDDDVSDYLLYGGDAMEYNSCTNRDQQHNGWNQTLWKRIVDLRKSENTRDTSISEGATRDQRKSVKFANEVEVNEIENPRDVATHEKMSKFKQNRSRSKMNKCLTFEKESTPYEITDEESNGTNESPISNRKKTSPNRDSDKVLERNLITLSRIKDLPASSVMENKFVSDGKKIDDLASDYVRGKFDDDLRQRGIIIDKVEDINYYNDHVQALQSSSSAQRDDSNSESEFENKDMAAAESDSYLNDIVEKPSHIPEDVESQLFGKQIRDDYYKIRTHISNKTMDEISKRRLVNESNVNSDGVSGKASKFKVSRLRG